MMLGLMAGLSLTADAQSRTVGLLHHTDAAFDGYTLFAPLPSNTTYLIDSEGRLVHQWTSPFLPANSAYLLPGGHLLRTAIIQRGATRFTVPGAGGRVEAYDWDGTLVWSYELADDTAHLHHDVEPLPNGNVLMIAWEYRSPEEALAAGRRPDAIPEEGVWPDTIIEVEPDPDGEGGTIVWTWRAWDHLIQDADPTKANYGPVAEHPELIDLNYASERMGNLPAADWHHANGIAYNPELDQIVLSVLTFSEFWVIDHSTTTEEAAGHTGGRYGRGGDLLYRWGNPQAYRAGTEADRQLYGLHDARWVPAGRPGAGNLMAFNNGGSRPDGAYSSVVEIAPPLTEAGDYVSPAPGTAFGPAAPVWTYTAPEPSDFFAGFLSGAQRLPNGNTLICDGAHGTFFEVTPSGEEVWRYVSPVIRGEILRQGEPVPGQGPRGWANTVFRATRYAPDYPGLAGRDLTPGAPLEGPATGTSTDPAVAEQPPHTASLVAYPNPIASYAILTVTLPHAARVRLAVYDLLGREVALLNDGRHPAGLTTLAWQPAGLAPGPYLLRLTAGAQTLTRPVVYRP